MHVSLRPDEGGLNLTMPPEMLKRLSERGLIAGQTLRNNFDLCSHIWARYRLTLCALRRYLDDLAYSWQAPVPQDECGWKQIDGTRPPHHYRPSDTVQQKQLQADLYRGLQHLMTLSVAWSGQHFCKDSPLPEAFLRGSRDTEGGLVSNITIQHRLGIVALNTMVWAVAMGMEAGLFDMSVKRILNRFESPVAALELAASPERVLAILNQGDCKRNVDVIFVNTYTDFLFIGLYCSVFWLFSDAYSIQSSLRLSIKAAIVVAGSFDVAENILMLREFHRLTRLTQALVGATRAVSLTKWAAFAGACWLLGIFVWSIARTQVAHASILKVIAGCVLLAGALATCGLFANRISIGVLPLLPALGCIAWIYTRQSLEDTAMGAWLL